MCNLARSILKIPLTLNIRQDLQGLPRAIEHNHRRCIRKLLMTRHVPFFQAHLNRDFIVQDYLRNQMHSLTLQLLLKHTSVFVEDILCLIVDYVQVRKIRADFSF